MSKLSVVQRVPSSYDRAAIQEIVRLFEKQANQHAEGSIVARHGAMTAAPTAGTWIKGDEVDNSSPSVVTTDVADYVIVGWICTASGSPGTWVERRAFTESISTAAATQAEQETGSSTTTFVSPGRQQFHPSAAKGWVSADMNGSVNASYNVTSVTDVAAANFTVNWGTDFSGAARLDLATVKTVETGADAGIIVAEQLAGSTEVRTLAGGGLSEANITAFFVAAFGDQ